MSASDFFYVGVDAGRLAVTLPASADGLDGIAADIDADFEKLGVTGLVLAALLRRLATMQREIDALKYPPQVKERLP